MSKVVGGAGDEGGNRAMGWGNEADCDEGQTWSAPSRQIRLVLILSSVRPRFASAAAGLEVNSLFDMS